MNAIRQTLAQNLRRQLEARFPDTKNLVFAVEAASGIPHSTIARVLTGSNSTTIDTVERLAVYLNIPAYTLIKPSK